MKNPRVAVQAEKDQLVVVESDLELINVPVDVPRLHRVEAPRFERLAFGAHAQQPIARNSD